MLVATLVLLLPFAQATEPAQSVDRLGAAGYESPAVSTSSGSYPPGKQALSKGFEKTIPPIRQFKPGQTGPAQPSKDGGARFVGGGR